MEGRRFDWGWWLVFYFLLVGRARANEGVDRSFVETLSLCSRH